MPAAGVCWGGGIALSYALEYSLASKKLHWLDRIAT